MKNLSLLLVFLLSQNVFAQKIEWLAPGAKWQITTFSANSEGIQTLRAEWEEVVNGQLCIKIRVFEALKNFVTNKSESRELSPIYAFSRNDSVFIAKDIGFRLLYDFTRKTGDTLRNLVNPEFKFGIVKAVGDSVLFGNLPVRFMDIGLWDGFETRVTRIYEGIGGKHFEHWDADYWSFEREFELDNYCDAAHPQNCQVPDSIYTKFPAVEAVWSEEQNNWFSYSGRQYVQTGGDTTLVGIGKGKKLWFRRTYFFNIAPPKTSGMYNEPLQFFGILLQDSILKNIYAVRTWDYASPFDLNLWSADFPLGKKVLIYDFDLRIGQQIAWKAKPNWVKSIDFVTLSNGEKRRRYHLEDIDQPSFFEEEWLIEGIGSSRGLFGMLGGNPTDSGAGLRCFRENDIFKYLATQPEFCDSIKTVGTDEPAWAGGVQVFPNPNFGNFNLQLPDEALPATATLSNFLGNEILKIENLRQPGLPVSMPSGTTDGFYFLKICDSRGAVLTRKIGFFKN